MSKEQKTTGNIQPPNKDLEILKKNFPNCFDKSGNLDFNKFKKQLSKKEINFSKESYGMDWLGKSYARLLATDETTTLLKEDETFNQKEENKNSENLLIKGDNLEVLKHLSNAYYEKVKMIYIDPPYNTGSDGFVYQDNRKFTIQELQELAGISEERAKRILDFTQSNSNSHSAWLTFMYPRLYIAKQLLKEDGTIFISIDDNEVTQLRLLMDEIFGEENFVGQLSVLSNPRGRAQDMYFATNNEFLLVYSKSILIKKSFNVKKDNEQLKSEYKNEDKNGFFRTLELRNTHREFGKFNRPNLFYPLYVNPQNLTVSLQASSTYKEKVQPIWEDGFEGCWTWGQNKSKLEIELLTGKFVNEKWKIYVKDYANNATKMLKTILQDKSFATDKGQKAFNDLFLVKEKIFQSPKSPFLLRTLIDSSSSDEDLVLDFFAGSGTTADAVMQLNAEDGGSRKSILVQLPELIHPKKNKTAYDFVKDELNIETPTIFEITKERLIRASKKIQEENKGKDLSKQDLGFKIFETMPIWEDYNFEADELDAQQMLLFNESKLTKEDIKALLVTWKTYDGVSLSQSLQDIDLTDYTANYSNGKLYLMDKGFKTKNLKTLLEKIDNDKDFNPTTIIAFGYHFESKNLREISENIKSYANKKSIDIDFITRY